MSVCRVLSTGVTELRLPSFARSLWLKGEDGHVTSSQPLPPGREAVPVGAPGQPGVQVFCRRGVCFSADSICKADLAAKERERVNFVHKNSFFIFMSKQSDFFFYKHI